MPRITQVRERRPFGADWYLLSGSPGLNLSACSDEAFGDARDAFTPGGAGGSSAADDMSGTVRQIDYGAVYASKSFKLQDNRTVWIGWVYEVRSVYLSWLPSEGTGGSPVMTACASDNMLTCNSACNSMCTL